MIMQIQKAGVDANGVEPMHHDGRMNAEKGWCNLAKIITAVIETEGANAGEVTIDLAGYKGKGCHAVQEIFTKGLGGKVLIDTRKPEYNATVAGTNCITR